MNWLLLLLTLVLGAIGIATWVIKTRSRDIEEVILQGRPILLRCGKLRVEGRSGGCANGEPSTESC